MEEVVAFVEWYNLPRSRVPKGRRPMYRDDADGKGGCSYPMKKESILTPKSLDVLRRMLLVQNAAYYIAHIAVANDARGVNMSRDIALVAETYAGEERPESLQEKRENGPDVIWEPPASLSKDAKLRHAGPSPPTGNIAEIPECRFSTGTAAVEAFFEEI